MKHTVAAFILASCGKKLADARRLSDPAARLKYDDANADAGPSTGAPDSSLGVLSSKRVAAAALEKGDAAERRLQLDTTCTDFVQCFDGFEASNPSTPCATACLEDPSNSSSTPLCCEGTDACEGFYGDVCRDGVSCSGTNACFFAEIGMVHHGCYGGDYACEFAYVGMVHHGCYGGDRACDYAGSFGDRVDKIVRGCSGTRACEDLASYDGYVGVVEDSCRGSESCQFAGERSGSNITSIRNSCLKPFSCKGAARDGGFIDGIEDACNFEKACYYAASPDKVAQYAGDIPSGIKSCCNSQQKECAYANETSLPDQCNTKAPTLTPTSSPTTSAPTSSPTTSTPTSAPTCKIDATCGPDLCFNAIDASECPAGKHEQLEFLLNVQHGCNAHVPMGGLCEADGECSTDNDLGNCKLFEFHGLGVSWDVYRRVECC